MSADSSYLTERLAERRKRVRSGVAGIAVLMALGLGLLLSYPMPAPSDAAAVAAGVVEQLAGSPTEPAGLTALR